MLAKSNKDGREGRRSAKSATDTLNLVGAGAHNLSVFHAPAERQSSLWAATRLGGSLVEGTVGAVVGPIDDQFYGSDAAGLISGDPLGPASLRRSVRPQIMGAAIRAKDLVIELQEISGQVNRMMTQVERAISRLGARPI